MADDAPFASVSLAPGQSVAWSGCPACGEARHIPFYEADAVPANSCILFPSENEAKSCPTGDIRLVLCQSCGFIFNDRFDLARTEYSGRYEETQAFSGTFNRFHESLARRLVERHRLERKRVIEIGCGKGEFLGLLAELGDNQCLGIDPGVHTERVKVPSRGSVRFIADFYSEAFCDQPVDLLVCKMTLEHIPQAKRFIASVRKGLGTQTSATAFFQIPEARRILDTCAFEDIYHEHCSYYTPGSLARLFRSCAFDVIDLDVAYGGQYLTIEARPRAPGVPPLPPLPQENDLGTIAELVASFPERCAAKLAHWRREIAQAHAAGERICLWGSGSKAVAFLAAVDPDGLVSLVTDINPYRHNHYMPRSAQRILPPAELAALKPDLVIVMNAIYEEEIRKALAEIGLAPRVGSL